jgi:hypothetical protein
MGFFIRYETHQDGPFDLITMIRKIRKGTIPPDVLVMEEADAKAVPARTHPALNNFFRELEDDYISEEAMETVDYLTFSDAVLYGWNFFKANLFSSFISALTIGAILAYSLVILIVSNGSLLPSAFLIGIATIFFLCGFIFMMQQLHRRLEFSFGALFDFYNRNWLNISLFSAVFSILIIAGLLALIIPGLIILTRGIFAPILVADQQFHFWHAIEASNRTVKIGGQKLYSVLLGLLGLNVAAGLFFIIPLIITLPITFAAIIEIYNRLDFR